MKQTAFEAKYAADWAAFEAWLAAEEGGRKTPLEAELLAAAEIPKRYREICHHLSLSRRRDYGPRLQQQLNELALRGHRHLYQARGNFARRIGRFLGVTFPAAFRRHWRFNAVAAVLLFAPAIALAIAIQYEPSLTYSVLDPERAVEYEQMYDASQDRIGEFRDADSNFMMFGFYVYNNVGIGLRCFGSGLIFGLGTIFLLLFNGIHLGTVFGFVTQIGHGPSLWQFVIGHGAFEITAIVITGAAGLMLGYSLWAPGTLTRIEAVRHAAMEALPLVIGASAMLVIAAFIEAFWSSITAFDVTVKYLVGAALWAFVLAYLLLFGRGHAA